MGYIIPLASGLHKWSGNLKNESPNNLISKKIFEEAFSNPIGPTIFKQVFFRIFIFFQDIPLCVRQMSILWGIWSIWANVQLFRKQLHWPIHAYKTLLKMMPGFFLSHSDIRKWTSRYLIFLTITWKSKIIIQNISRRVLSWKYSN